MSAVNVNMSTAFVDRAAFEAGLTKMLDKLCSNRKAKLCKKFSISEESDWSQEQCFVILAKCMKKKDLAGCVQVFRQWHCLLMTEQAENNARLIQECVNHKRAATSAQNTCKALQERVAKLERENKEFQKLAARKEKLYPCLKDFHHRPIEQSVRSGSNHSSGEEGYNPTRLEAAPVMAKLVKSRERELKTSIKHNTLNPEQIDCMSKEFKHPMEMGIGPFLTLMTRKIKLYSLHPLDVISVCSQILMPDEIETMEEYYGKQLGKLKSLRAVQDCNVGLLTVLQKSVGSTLCWKRIIECYQGKNEPVRQYTQRFAEVYLVHGGRSEFNSVADVLNSLVSVVQWADGLTQSMRKVLPFLKSAWRTSTLSELSEYLTAYERDAHVKRSISSLLRTVFQRRNSQNSQNKSNSVCHCCGKKGHWARECKLAKWQEHKPQPRPKEEQSSTSGVETSSDSGDSGSGDSPDQTCLNQTALQLATVIVKEEKTEGEMSTKHEPLNPEQVDCLAEGIKLCHQNGPVNQCSQITETVVLHGGQSDCVAEKVMSSNGIERAEDETSQVEVSQSLPAVQSHVIAVSQKASHEDRSQRTHDSACDYCSEVGPCKCKKKTFEARSKLSLDKLQSKSVGGVIFPKVAGKLLKLIKRAAQFSATPEVNRLK